MNPFYGSKKLPALLDPEYLPKKKFELFDFFDTSFVAKALTLSAIAFLPSPYMTFLNYRFDKKLSRLLQNVCRVI